MKFAKLALVVCMSVAGMNSALAAGPSGDAPTGVDQGHGQITFTGSIIDAPCSISPESQDQTVPLGEISSAALKDGGTSTAVPFTIDLDNCDTSGLTDKTVSVTFTGAASDVGTNLLALNGDAKGAGIGIKDVAGNDIVLGTATDPQNVNDSNNQLHFSAFLQGDNASGAIIPGGFTSVAQFTLAYN
ncbi:fimbrial protein [Scandinavium goeteborgense]|uniref:fimbrial protein n=1 Tax=Scandinavium goeteborgense TaxID=1851514 RepID=UPI000F6913F0|nr:fimbrial protein [Scandinavium goeteborgense]QKN79769.1 type 1 fimbrial protein [Scandinavium goeteborgense]